MEPTLKALVTHIEDIQVERKRLTLDLKENLSGMFLRITEEVTTGHRNSIVIPATGLELFRDTLNEVIRFGKSLGGVERSSRWGD